MANYTIYVYDYHASGYELGGIFPYETTVINVPTDAQATVLTVSDDDTILHDSLSGAGQITDANQFLVDPVTVNGKTFAAGSEVFSTAKGYFTNNTTGETGYYYQLQLDNGVETTYAFAYSVPVSPGDQITYEITPNTYGGGGFQYYIGQEDYSAFAPLNSAPVCFAEGALIDTPSGPRRVETLRAGDLVNTMDHGPKPILWRGQRRVCGLGKWAPVVFDPTSCTISEPLRVTAQHQIAVAVGEREFLVRAKHLASVLPGVRIVPDPSGLIVHHLLVDGHELLGANGIACESLNPGPMVRRALTAAQRREVQAALPACTWERPALAPSRPRLNDRALREIAPDSIRILPFAHRGAAPVRRSLVPAE